MKKNYFTTGEFAKICNVSKQTLFSMIIKAYFLRNLPEKTDIAIIHIRKLKLLQ